MAIVVVVVDSVELVVVLKAVEELEKESVELIDGDKVEVRLEAVELFKESVVLIERVEVVELVLVKVEIVGVVALEEVDEIEEEEEEDEGVTVVVLAEEQRLVKKATIKETNKRNIVSIWIILFARVNVK